MCDELSCWRLAWEPLQHGCISHLAFQISFFRWSICCWALLCMLKWPGWPCSAVSTVERGSTRPTWPTTRAGRSTTTPRLWSWAAQVRSHCHLTSSSKCCDLMIFYFWFWRVWPGPVLLEDYHLVEKIASFHREYIPKRIVHARGAGAKGYFEVTHHITHLAVLTCADFLRGVDVQVQNHLPSIVLRKHHLLHQFLKFLVAVQTPLDLIAQFSTVIHKKGSSETLTDPAEFIPCTFRLKSAQYSGDIDMIPS